MPDSQTQQKECPHFLRLPLETAPLTDHRDAIIFPPVRHRALRVRTKLSVPSHPRPAPGHAQLDGQRERDKQEHTLREPALQGILLYLLRHTRTAGRKAHTGDNDIQLEDLPTRLVADALPLPVIYQPGTQPRNIAITLTHGQLSLSFSLTD